MFYSLLNNTKFKSFIFYTSVDKNKAPHRCLVLYLLSIIYMTNNFKIFAFLLLLAFTSLESFGQRGSELLIQANRATLERQYGKALDLYNQYIALNPEDFRGYFNRGTTAYNATKYEQAFNDFTKTLELNPIYKEAYYYRGMTLAKQTKYDEAIRDYSHVLSTDSNSVPFLKLRSEAYASLGKEALALNDLNQAVDLAKLSGDLYKRRAELKVKMKDIDGALRDYNSVEKLIPAYKMVHYIKGNLYLELKETEFACDEFQLALDNQIVVADRPYSEYCQ